MPSSSPLAPLSFAPDIARIFEDRVAAKTTPGAWFAVFDRAGLVASGGAGRKNDAGAPPDAQTRFRVASCTKSFTAAMVMILRDAGALHLDDPITRFVPELRPTLPRARPAPPTVRMLLTMSGGLPGDDPWADRQEALSSHDFRALLSQGVHFCSVPGTAYEYSNLGYALLGQVIEQVTGTPYCDAVTAHLLAPLGLHATTFDFAAVPPGDLAVGYRRRGNDWVALPFSGPGAFSCIGGVITTAGDLAAWGRWLCAAFNQDHADDAVLSAASRREMQQIARAIPRDTPAGRICAQGYGFGLRVDEDPLFGPIVHHSGGYPGFSSHMRWGIRAGIGIVVLENATYAGASIPAAAALQQVLEALPAPPRPAAPPEVRALVERLKGLLADWSPALADEICLANVALDRPYPERAAEIAALTRTTGRPDFARATIEDVEGAADFSRFALAVPCAHGVLRCQVHLGPPLPRRIQGLSLTAISDGSAAA